MILAGDFIPKNLKVRLPDDFKGQLVLVNLEGPICADGLPKSNKVGVCLRSEVAELSGWGVEKFAFSLANNHMMDYGEEGLRQTKEALASLGIPFAGAGDSEEEARKPMILEEDGKRIAVFCCCERQFGMATSISAGCAEKGVWIYNAIRAVKKLGQADYVVVSCHAASEFSPWVSPALHDFYHSLVDVGADVIHGHHAHVPQGFEEYRGKPVFYGLGNFVVDPAMWRANADFLWSEVVELTFADERIEWKVVPYCMRPNGGWIGVESGSDEHMASYLQAANRQFANPDLLMGLWQEVSCWLYVRIYEQSLRAPSVVAHAISIRDRLRKMLRATGDMTRALRGREFVTSNSLFYGKVLFNLMNCESHVEMVRTALGVLTGVVPDLRTDETHGLVERVLEGR